MFKYLRELNDEQRKAVEDIENNLLVIAGAGSGKTRTLTYKVRYLIDNGFEPESILCVTFTNKAANEMKERLAIKDVHKLNIGTFHSIGYRLLRKHYQLLGFKTVPTIYTDFDVSLIIARLKKKYKYAYNNLTERISYFKNTFATYEEIVSETNDEIFATIYNEYRDILKTSNAVDFDDLQMYWYRFMDTQEGKDWVKSIRYVLVDEFQDTNTAQFLILEKMHRINPECKFFVVGDDYQAIYSFRGANINNILYSYERSFAPVKTVYLVKNYRSKPQIVELSNRIIRFNKNQKHKEMVHVRQENDECVTILDDFYDPTEEAKFVADTITRLMIEHGYEYKDFAVLYRINRYSLYLTGEFERRGIPFEVKVLLPFADRFETRLVISLISLAFNPYDLSAFDFLTNVIYGIAEQTVNKMYQMMKEEHRPVLEVLDKVKLPRKASRVYIDKLKNVLKTIPIIPKTQVIEYIFSEYNEQTLKELKNKAGIKSNKNNRDSITFDKQVQELLQQYLDEFFMMNPDATLIDFKNEITIGKSDTEDDSEDDNKVQLMSVHASKGLEFKVVFVVGVCDGLFPSPLNDNIEEERRLFYVAMTRAMDRLYISSVATIPNTRQYYYGPSIFLEELQMDFIF